MIDLVATAHALFSPGKGILAADESVHTADARLAECGITPGPEMRRLDRELFLEAEGIEDYLSGVILYTETFSQKESDEKFFPDSLAARGIHPGIKIDEGTEPLPESPKELITRGLLGLPERLASFKRQGAVFTKWRAVLRIDGPAPSASALTENAKRLAAYAKQAQEAGLVPIIEPEVLYEGTHSRKRAEEVIQETLGVVFQAAEEQSVELPALILKTAMALSGKESGKRDTPEEVAESTLGVLSASVPRGVAGIVFLSGGQTPDQATANLAAIVRLAKERNAPWPMTFSYARALQDEALAVWKGEPANVALARAAFLSRLAKVAAALQM